MSDKNIDKAKGRAKEAAGALSGHQASGERRARRSGQGRDQGRRGQGCRQAQR